MPRSQPLFLSLISLSVLLSGCGSSDTEETTYSEAYLQFYNGSSNSAATYLRDADGTSYSSATYGDATPLYTLASGEYELEFYRSDEDDQEVTVSEVSLTANEGEKTLIILSGDFEQPEFNVHTFERNDLEDHFRLFVTNLTQDQQAYDVYMAEEGAPFDAANYLSSINYQSFEEMVYWQGDDDSADFDQDEYVIYLTLPGSNEVVFESPALEFAYATEYAMVLRNSSGAIQGELEIDVVLNTTIVTNVADNEATSQFRIYNSLDDESSLTVTLAGNDEQAHEVDMIANGLSGFTKINFGDYRLSASLGVEATEEFSNRLVTLNQGQSKALLFMRDSEGQLTSMSFEESNLPQQYDKQVQVANLTADFDEVDIYFVRNDETIDTAQYQLTGIDFSTNKTISLPSDYYELIAVYDSADDTRLLLDRTPLLGINEEQNYIVTVEPDAESATGYSVSLLY